MKVTLYARVSSENQADNSLSIRDQIKALRKFSEDNKYSITNIFIDEAKSGRTDKRAQFQEMISLAKRNSLPFEAILVWKLDRFARNREHSIVYKSLLNRNGIQVISINEPIEDTASGKMLEGMLEVISEFYSNNMAQDIKRGMEGNTKRGYFNGGVVPYGYIIKKVNAGGVKKSKLEIDKTRAQIVEKIFSLYLGSNGAKEIAKILNQEYGEEKTWAKNGVLNILRNEVYIGNLVWNRGSGDTIKSENAHQPIIKKDIFIKVQKILDSRKPAIVHPRSVSSNNHLNGILFCKECKNTYTSYSAKSGAYHYYTCQSRFKSGKKICSQKDYNIGKLDSLIMQSIKEKILTEDNIQELLILINEKFGIIEKDIKDRLSRIDRMVESKTKALNKWYRVFEDSEDVNISDIAPRIKALKDEIDKLGDEKIELHYKLELNKPPKLTEQEIQPYLDELREILLLSSITEQKSFIRSFIEKISLDKESATIEYTFPLNPNEKSSNKEVLVLSSNGRQ